MMPDQKKKPAENSRKGPLILTIVLCVFALAVAGFMTQSCFESSKETGRPGFVIIGIVFLAFVVFGVIMAIVGATRK